jgi:hypothetical protein
MPRRISSRHNHATDKCSVPAVMCSCSMSGLYAANALQQHGNSAPMMRLSRDCTSHNGTSPRPACSRMSARPQGLRQRFKGILLLSRLRFASWCYCRSCKPHTIHVLCVNASRLHLSLFRIWLAVAPSRRSYVWTVVSVCIGSFCSCMQH